MLITKIADPAKLREEFGDRPAEILQSVTYIGFQKEGWGEYSGANGILSLLPVQGFYLKRPVPGFIYRAWKPFRGFFRKRNAGYEINSLYLESKVALDWIRKRSHIYHFLSGENEYFYSGSLKRLNRNNRIVCTYHSPVTEYRETVLDQRKIQRIDGAIVVARNMVEFFSSLVGSERVWRVPLGVDSGFWNPGSPLKNKDTHRVLFIGSHFRDFDVLKKVICMTLSRNKDVRFDAVLASKDAMALNGVDGVTVHIGIDDLQLRSLYQTSDVLICPLRECTASLTLLEALACGLPVIATRTGGVPDYVTEGSGILTAPGDAEEMTEQLLLLINDEMRQQHMSKAARERGLALDWHEITVKLTGVYSDLLAR